MNRPPTCNAESLPRAHDRPVALRIHPAAERAVRSGHPWVFEGSVRSESRIGSPGDVAVVFDRKNRFLAAGLYDPAGPIRARLLVHGDPETIGPHLLETRVIEAIERRKGIVDSSTTGVRLVHGEGDGLSGLVIDRYGSAAVIKIYSSAWVPHLRAIVATLVTSIAPTEIVLLLARHVRDDAHCPPSIRAGALLHGSARPSGEGIPFLETDLHFEAHPFLGHKTGFYLDQRENRRRLERTTKGARVLNVFSYAGGFSLYAARGGAREIVSVDQAAPALAQAARHFALNSRHPGVAEAHHRTLQGDAFQRMKDLAEGRERFGVVVVDPPSFAKERAQVAVALRQYTRLTRLALDLLSPGGLLVQASCSSRVADDDFFSGIQRAARDAGRTLTVEAQTGHPADHPVRFPEGAYLKCLWARAE